MQVHDLFGDIPAFVNGGQIPEVTAGKPQDILNDQLQPAVEIFKAARLFNPTKIAEIQPTAAILSDQLRKVPFLNNDACIDGLQGNYQLTLLQLLMSILILMF